ncbi:MAG: hypothetical protein ACKVWV_02790 [Planctomycetota bacterium]
MVEFDCKVATVTTKDNAVLTELEASNVMKDAGFEVVSFTVGEAPKRTALIFRVNEFEPYVRASLENGFREDMKDADKVAVDSLGRATVVVSGEAAAEREILSLSLKKRGVAAEGFETKSWPKLGATYVVAVSGMHGAVETRTVADALAGVAKVVAVHVYQDAGTATLWLKEPCDALEANVMAALTRAGFSVSRFELKVD